MSCDCCSVALKMLSRSWVKWLEHEQLTIDNINGTLLDSFASPATDTMQMGLSLTLSSLLSSSLRASSSSSKVWSSSSIFTIWTGQSGDREVGSLSLMVRVFWGSNHLRQFSQFAASVVRSFTLSFHVIYSCQTTEPGLPHRERQCRRRSGRPPNGMGYSNS